MLRVILNKSGKQHPSKQQLYGHLTTFSKTIQMRRTRLAELSWKSKDEELDSVLRKIKNRKAAGLDEIPPEEWKTRHFDDILLRHCNAVYNQNPIDRWMNVCILPFLKKADLGLAKNYRGITLTSIAAKIYNTQLRNRIEPKIDNILRKNQNGFRRNRSMTSHILTIRRILEGVRAKNLLAKYFLSALPRPLIPFTEGRWSKFKRDRRSHNDSL